MALRVVQIEARGLGLCTPAGCPLDKVLNQVRGLFVAEGKCWEGLSCEPAGPALLWPRGRDLTVHSCILLPLQKGTSQLGGAA